MEQRCKKHPTHKLSKGVCPSCLRERLSSLLNHSSSSSSSTYNTSNSNSSTISSSSSSSSYSPSPYSLSDSNISSISCGSPIHKFMAKTKSFSYGNNMIKPLMMKSRSLFGFVVEQRKDMEDFKEKKIRIKRGRFWSKLMGRRKEEEIKAFSK